MINTTSHHHNYSYVEVIVSTATYCHFSYTGNWELVKSIVRTKFRRSHVCLHSHAEIRLWQLIARCSLLLCYDNFCSKTNTGDKIKCSRLPKNTETQQEMTKENTKNTTEINCDWSKKIKWGHVECHFFLIADFKNRDKNVKILLKVEQIQVP